MSNGSWTLLREARDDTWPAADAYFRVHVVFNAKTSLYVLWVNTLNGPANYAVGTSPNPEGPFTFVQAVDLGREGHDFDIFVDEDLTAYAIYTGNHSMSIEMLADDYLSSLASTAPWPNKFSTGIFGLYFVEAPAMFKRNGLYYALFGNCCCFCSRGSGIGVYTAHTPLGPWTYHDNVGCQANTSLTPGCGCGKSIRNTTYLLCRSLCN